MFPGNAGGVIRISKDIEVPFVVDTTTGRPGNSAMKPTLTLINNSHYGPG